MDFSKIIMRSFEILKKYRYLLWLGIIAGFSEGGINGNFSSFFQSLTSKSKKDSPEIPAQYLLNNWHHIWQLAWPYFVVIVGISLLITILIIYVSNSSRAALIKIADNIEEDRHRKQKFSQYFNSGIPFVWRLFCLDIIACAIIFFAVIIILMPMLIAGFIHASPVLFIISGLILMFGLLVLIILVLYLGVIVKYASRIIVLEDTGPIEALRDARQIVHLQFQNSFIAILINMGLNIALTIIIVISLITVGLILFGLGYTLYMVTQVWVVVVYSTIASIALMSALIVVCGAFSTFISTYWTLTYRAAKYLAHKKQRRAHES